MTSTVDYGDRIPNYIDLGRDRVLQRALEHWQPYRALRLDPAKVLRAD